ncbi:MAG TPA: hypothetical protein GX714_01425 [Chloroflexi bacterium]|jgi:hypothetical protein|nr:hypothetical protein [Chloroflexota bacterium]
MACVTPSLHRARVQATLITVLDHVWPACAERYAYRLVGTAAAVLHGVDLPTADIDILVKTPDAVDAFGAALAPCPCLSAPAWLPAARQYYGSYDVHGVTVEFSTVNIASDEDTRETFGRGPWERYVALPCGPYTVPTVALELRLITELLRDRADRYAPILRALSARGCDRGFMRRAMAAVGLPPEVRQRVLDELQGPPTG